MAKFMLIGGGNVGRGNTSYETEIIDKEVVKMSGKTNPNFLFIGLASDFSDSYFKTIKKIYSELGCQCNYLKKKNIINNPDIVKDKITKADIIYFCGGDSIKLVNKLVKFGIDKLLKDVVKEDKVFVGMSAGAIMMCNDGYSDSLIIRSESDKYEFVSGLNFLNISFCPHYEENNQKGIELKNDLKDKKRVLALNDKCAIKIIDNKYEIISEDKNSNAYICYIDKEYKSKLLTRSGSISKIVL